MMRPLLIGIPLGVAAVGALQLFGTYGQFIAGQFCVLVIITAGLNLLMGVAGLLSVASAAFVGLGANVATILMVQAGVPYPLAVLAALVAGWVVGWLIGLLSLRVEGFYLAVVTLGFLQVFLAILDIGRAVTGGGYGLVVPAASLPLIGELTGTKIAGCIVFLAALTLPMLHSLMASRIGRGWVALKDHPAAAELCGIDPIRYKTLAFALSSLLVSLGGALQAVLLGVTNPSAYNAYVAITHISYVVVGGMTASIAGSIAGPLILFVVPELVRDLGEYREIFYGSVMLLALILAPKGFAGLAEDLDRRFWHKEGAR
jgi:branched-chain amino acid transport system permease protein